MLFRSGVAALTLAVALVFIRGEWFLSVNGDTVGIYRGVNTTFMGVSLSTLVETSAVSVSDLPASVQDQLVQGIRVQSEEAGRETLNAYREQIDKDKTAAANVAEVAKGEGEPDGAVGDSSDDAGAQSGTDAGNAAGSADGAAGTAGTADTTGEEGE